MAGETRQTADGRYICTFAGCGYTHDKEKGVRLHYYARHDRDRLTKRPAGPAPGPAGGCGRPGCSGRYQLLTRTEPAQARAMTDGWRLVCPECGRLKE